MKNILLFIALIITGCNAETESTMNEKITLSSMSDIPESAWLSLSKKNIYFGHQSVGDNIIDGVTKIVNTNDSINLNIKHINAPEIQANNNPVFAHSYIGKNGDTDSKYSDFKSFMRNGLGDTSDLAFLKLCYWDIRRNTDINSVFNNYKNMIIELKREYPNTTFIHSTVPLMSHSNSLIDNIKRILRPDNDDLDNIKRNELNTLILNEYSANEPVFDIALVEATLPNGELATFTNDGKKYYYLPDEYTHDGAHLNDYAREHVAEQLLITLANIIEK